MSGHIAISIDLRPHSLEGDSILTFGACLSAGPLKDHNGHLPPPHWQTLAVSSDYLAPFKPWKWSWAEKEDLANPTEGTIGWSMWLRHTAQPDKWHRIPATLISSIISHGGIPSALPDLYTAVLDGELARLDLLENDGSFKPAAYSQSFGLFWKGDTAIKETDLPASVGTEGFSSDRLMSALGRWSVARPPLNFAARLAWAINLKGPDLDIFLKDLQSQQGWPDAGLSNVHFVAIPYESDQTPAVASLNEALACATLPPWDADAPVGLELRLACNCASAYDEAGASLTVEPETQNWRRLMSTRLVRFFSLPETILALAAQPAITSDKWLRWREWSIDPDISSEAATLLKNLWTWIVASSADTFSATALGHGTSWWHDCTGLNEEPPLSLFTAKRNSVAEWIEWVSDVTKPGAELALKENDERVRVPNNSQWQALSDLADSIKTRLNANIIFDFEAPLRADPSGRMELNLMAEFVAALQAPEVLRLLIPTLWVEAGVNEQVIEKLIESTANTMLGGAAPNETIQPALGVAKVHAHWTSLLDKSSLGNQTGELVERLGGARGIVVAKLYEARRTTAAGTLRPSNLPDLGKIFPEDLAILLPGGLAEAAKWIAGDMDKPVAQPHGITLAVAAEETEKPGHEIESGNALQENAGFLIFAKKENLPWRCLTQVRPVGPTDEDWKTVLAIPLDIGYEDGRLTCTFTYDNQPLAAISLADRRVAETMNRLQSSTSATPLLRYEMPLPNSDEQTGVMPGLVYGCHCEFVALPVKNSCLLHSKLCSVHPASLDFKKLADTAFTWGGIPGVILFTKQLYLRRVGIGMPRISNCWVSSPISIKPVECSWPQLPPGVMPLSAEIRQSGQDDISTAESEEPLVLLFSPRILKDVAPRAKLSAKTISSIVIDIQKPSTDIENWDRWVAKDRGKIERAKVWGEVDKERDLNPRMNDALPDDPAVSDFALLEWERVYPESSPPGTARVLHVAKYPNGIGEYKRDPLKLSIDAVDSSDWKLTEATNDVTVHVPEGQVWQVTLHNLVAAKYHAKGNDQRLDGKVFTFNPLSEVYPNAKFQGREEVVQHLEKWFACSAHSFRVETASTEMPTELDLWNALTPKTSGDQLQLYLEYGHVTERPAAMAFLSALKIRHQIWRWNGRPAKTSHVHAPGEAKPDPNHPDRTYISWDGIGFHDREDSQHRVISERLIYQPIATNPKVLIFTDDRRGDGRALYSRFGLEAPSRYFSVTEVTVTARQKLKKPSGGHVFDPWRRHLMPVRLRHPLKRPLIRAMLPLTSSDNTAAINPLHNPGSSPGMMILLAEPFYQQAGIVEQLDCEVVTGKAGQEEYLQAGFDPVLSKKQLAAVTGNHQHRLVLDAPVGLTFDVGATDPLITSSCFFCRVPEELHDDFAQNAGKIGATTANTFFKVRLRRAIRERVDPQESADEVQVRESLASEWTESEWVRLLPDAKSLLLAWPSALDGKRTLVLQSDGTTDVAGWQDPYPWPVEASADFLSTRFSYALLVSRMLPDTSGRLREIYHCALRGNGNGKFGPFKKTEKNLKTEDKGKQIVVRIMELFHRSPLPAESDLWTTLFPNEPERPDLDPREDAGARIERMSVPFKITLM